MFVSIKSNNAFYSISYGYSQHKARNHNLGTSSNCCDIHSISKNQYQVILARCTKPIRERAGTIFLYGYCISIWYWGSLAIDRDIGSE